MPPREGKLKPGYVNKPVYPNVPCAGIWPSTKQTVLAVLNPRAKASIVLMKPYRQKILEQAILLRREVPGKRKPNNQYFGIGRPG